MAAEYKLEVLRAVEGSVVAGDTSVGSASDTPLELLPVASELS